MSLTQKQLRGLRATISCPIYQVLIICGLAMLFSVSISKAQYGANGPIIPVYQAGNVSLTPTFVWHQKIIPSQIGGVHYKIALKYYKLPTSNYYFDTLTRASASDNWIRDTFYVDTLHPLKMNSYYYWKIIGDNNTESDYFTFQTITSTLASSKFITTFKPTQSQKYYNIQGKTISKQTLPRIYVQGKNLKLKY